MNRSAAVVRLCSSSPHLLLLIHDLVHDWGRVARQLHTVRCPRLSPAPASRLCHGRELRSPPARGGSDAGWTAPEGVRPRACAVPTAVARARGLAPPRETARPSREPEPRSRGWERGGRGRAALAARGGAGTQHHKGMAGMGATRGGTPPRRGRLNYHGSRKQHAPHPLLPPWKLSSDCHPGCALLCSCAVLAHSTSEAMA